MTKRAGAVAIDQENESALPDQRKMNSVRVMLWLIAIWLAAWLIFWTYAISAGALRVATDKGALLEAYAIISSTLIVLPGFALLLACLFGRLLKSR